MFFFLKQSQDNRNQSKSVVSIWALCPRIGDLMAEQLNVNGMWQRDLKLGTIRPSSQAKQRLDGPAKLQL